MMFNKSKIVLSIAIVLGTASGAFAATKHHGHKGPAAYAPVSASAFGANASASGNNGRAAQGLTDDPPGSAFQDAGYHMSLGLAPGMR
jgi:hypothetical protein